MSKPARIAATVLASLILIAIGLGAYAYLRVTQPDLAFGDLFAGRDSASAQGLSPEPGLPAASPSPSAVPTAGAESSGETPAPADPTPEPEAVPVALDPSLMGKRVNILALGYDMSAERREAGSNARTDTMMFVSIDTAGGTLDIISLPRDSYVRLPNGSRNKINTAFAFGGGEEKGGFLAACETVSTVLGGIPVDYYVGVDMNLFKQLVDAIGGVDYDVDIAFTMNGRALETGFQHLSGQQVLDYCRFRHSGRGDIDRIDRQQRIMLAILDQTKQAGSLLHLPEIIASVTDNLRTNLSLTQIGALAWIAKDIPAENIHRYTLPGFSSTLYDISYWLVKQQEKQAMIEEIFGITVTLDPADDANALVEQARAEEAQGGINWQPGDPWPAIGDDAPIEHGEDDDAPAESGAGDPEGGAEETSEASAGT